MGHVSGAKTADFCEKQKPMNPALATAMIRQSPPSQARFPNPAAFVLLLLLSGAVSAEAPTSEAAPNPDWCNCPAIVAAETEDLEAQLIAETRERQAECRESLGVDMTQQRKGQGARMDTCRCSCLENDGTPREGPWGDRKKPARAGR